MVLILPLLTLSVSGSGKRKENLLFSFHLETSKDEYPKFAQAVKMGDPARQYYFRIMPSITDDDVEWYYPFISDDDTTYGVAFKLSAKGTGRLTSLTSLPENHGRLLASNVQALSDRIGPVRNYVQIDRRISDGVLVIWQGLSDDHLRVFSRRFPHVRDLMGEG